MTQRFDSALRLNVHLHTLAPDGIYVKTDDGGLGFLRLPRPSEDEVYDVAFRTTPQKGANHFPVSSVRGWTARGAAVKTPFR
ncbi:MAG: hypothetical protein IPM54_21240 [Polyangiaceae bacterium]|nr:hypothetical protein [Polyangiaceae bacterium]